VTHPFFKFKLFVIGIVVVIAYPFLGMANVERDGDGCRWIPTPWNPII
jgi:hypothetical protein